MQQEIIVSLTAPDANAMIENIGYQRVNKKFV